MILRQVSVIPEKIIYSSRKTLALQITREGSLVIRAPIHTNKDYIQKFILQKKDWIEKTIQKVLHHKSKQTDFTISVDQKKEYKKLSREVLVDRLVHWSRVMNLQYTSFRLSSAKTRWGSCSGKNSINLNWRLVMTPAEVIDYVVIHELAHIKQKNHSVKFWEIVQTYDPLWKQRRKWLRENQGIIRV